MISPIGSSLIYSMKRRRVMELFPPRLRKLWKEWDLRLMVLLSITLQIILIILGNRRKYDRKLWIRIVLWSAYLAADYVATFALGIISNNLSDFYDDNDVRSLDVKTEITAFWAPFLLLHLGGPDTITAYALEDNELWLRHFLQLLVQTGITIYVFIMAWTGSFLSNLFMVMFLVGLIKYGERTWVLRSASNEKLRESTLISHVSYSRYTYFDEEQEYDNLRRYIAEEDLVPEFKLAKDLPILNENSISDEDKLLTAYRLLDVTKSIFLDVVLRDTVRDKTRSIFENMSFENAFNIIEMELGLIYDLFYTKTPLLYTPWGFCLRLVTLFLTCFVLVLFIFLSDRNQFSKEDLSITFLLLVVAIILEICSGLIQFFSDRFVIWLSMHKKTYTLQALSYFSLRKNPRWSNKISQCSLLSFSLKEKPLPCHHILKHLSIVEKLEKQWYIAYKEVPMDLKKFIFQFYKWQGEQFTVARTFLTALRRVGGFELPNRYSYWEMHKVEGLAQSIFIWHIATELCYYLDRHDMAEDIVGHCKSIKWISRYMLYLIVMHPANLSVDETNQIIFQETRNEMTWILFEETSAKGVNQRPKLLRDKTRACKKLLQRYTGHQSGKKRCWSRRSVLRSACELALNLNTAQNLAEKWESITRNWLDMMDDAASRCKGNQHGQQLRRGGEFLTHVWLLKKYFGAIQRFRDEADPGIESIGN